MNIRPGGRRPPGLENQPLKGLVEGEALQQHRKVLVGLRSIPRPFGPWVWAVRPISKGPRGPVGALKGPCAAT